MRTLSIFRHAKSSWDNERLADFDRPLAQRGLKAARRMGRHMREIGLAPNRVVCSPAVRTRETAALALAELGRADLEIAYDGALYEAEVPVLMGRLAAVGDGISHLLLIGHNPGLQELALTLAGDVRSPERAAIARKLPTAALVVLELAIEGWRDIRPECGRIVHFMTPRGLEAD
jgi:phosphohistidine phosphatase